MHRSRNSIDDMDFFHFWTPFVRIFQIVGISHYGIFRPELKNLQTKLLLHRSYFAIIFLIRLASACFFLKVALTTRVILADKFNVSPIFVGVNIATRISQFLCFTVIPFETFFKRHTEQKLFETLQRIDEICRKKLKYVIDYRAHYRRQMVKTWLCYIAATCIYLSSYFISIPVHDSGSFVYMCIFVVSRLRVFQFAFFINTSIDVLGDLRTVMRRQQQRVKYNPARWKDIQCARKIYSNISCLKILINDCFGYSMIMFVADTAVKIVDSLYWFFLNNESLKSGNMYLR